MSPTARRATYLSMFALVALVTASRLRTVDARQDPALPFGVNYFPAEQLVTVQDFASHLAFSRRLLLGRLARPYTVEAHLRFMKSWTGRDLDFALPYGYSPVMALTLAPLAALPARWAWLLWTSVAMALVLACAARRVVAGWAEREPLAPVFLAAVLLSPTLAFTLEVGQTALWSAIALAVIAGLAGAARPGTLRGEWLLAVALFFLASKPTIALAAAVGLLALGAWRALLASSAAIALVLALFTARYGASWIGDYLRLAGHYTADEAPAAFAWSLQPEHMTNLRSALTLWLGLADSASSRASGAVWLASSAALLWARWREKLDGRDAALLAMVLYAAFCPHLTESEDLVLALPVLAGWTRPRTPLVAALVLIALYVGPDRWVLAGPSGALLALAAKLALLTVLAARAWRGRTSASAQSISPSA